MVFARKRFGQNFLQDASVIENIVRALQAQADDTVIEIGPGRAALTEKLLERFTHLTVIEIDRDLFAELKHLKQADKLTALCQDALEVDFRQFGQGLHLIGNLPYNISTPLMFHLLSFRDCIDEMLFMLQFEVVARLCAQPGSEDYGRISVMFQYYCDLELVLEVAPHCFKPAPKVMSAVISIKPKHQTERLSFSSLETIVKQAFAMRRKTLNNNFKGIFSEQDWQEIGICSTLRAQDLSIIDFEKIALFWERRTKLNIERH